MPYTLVLLTHNAESYLDDIASSIASCSVQPTEIIFVDSASQDETVARTKKLFPDAIHLPQVQNVDFCKGYNIAIAHAKTEHVVMINQRITMAPDAIEKMLETLSADDRIAIVGPALLQQDGSTVDSLGIGCDKRRYFFNIGEGKKMTDVDTSTPVFAASGAALLLRKSACEMIANASNTPGEYFDTDFIAYKDDIDIAYRLRLMGWKIVVDRRAIMHYDRSGKKTGKREMRTQRMKVYSLRNQWWMLLKNEPFSAILTDSAWILIYESMKMTYLLFSDPKTVLRVIPSYFRKLPRMMKKRHAIQQSATHAIDLKQWFS